MRRTLLALAFVIASVVPALGQVVAQGAPAPTSDARAWPFKIVFGGVQVDPRDITDNAARLLGQITFVSPQHVIIDSSAAIAVTGTFFQATQPVSLASVPTHAVTQSGGPWDVQFGSAQHVIIDSATLGTVTVSNAGLSNIDLAVTALRDALRGASAKTLTDVVNALGSLTVAISGTVTVSGTVTANAGSGTQAVSLATLPALTAGSAVIGHVIVDTAPTTAVTNAGLTNLDVALSTRTKPADQQHAIIDSGSTVVTQGTGTNLHVVADSGSTTAVTGTVAVSAASLPLPSGAATAALQGVTDADDASIANGQTAVVSLGLNQAYDGSVWRRMTFGTAGSAASQVWTVQGVASMTPVQVSQATAANLNATVSQATGTNLHVVVDSAPSTAVTNSGLSNIPADPAREGGNLATIAGKDFATQTTLALVKTDVDKIPSQGQAAEGASMPVVLPSTQITTLTPPAAITGFALEAGHLATIDASMAEIAVAVNTPGTTIPSAVMMLGAADPTGATQMVRASAQGQLAVQATSVPGLPKLPCNAVRRQNCQPKGY